MVWFGFGLNMFGDGGHKPRSTQKPGWGAGGWQRHGKQMSGAVSIKPIEKGLKKYSFLPLLSPGSSSERAGSERHHCIALGIPAAQPSPAALEGPPVPCGRWAGAGGFTPLPQSRRSHRFSFLLVSTVANSLLC